MRIYFTLKGAHFHMRLFMNGGKLGDLCCREEEFTSFVHSFSRDVMWIAEDGDLSPLPEGIWRDVLASAFGEHNADLIRNALEGRRRT